MPFDIGKNSKCAICLEETQDTTYLNPCNHSFCFDCIQKWSRKKVICPLCKQRFHSFFHAKSMKGAFREYVLPMNDGSCSHSGSREERPMSPPDNGIVYDEIRGTLTQREKEIYQLMRQFAVTKRPANIDVITLGKFKAQAVIQFRRALYQAGILVQNVQNPDFHPIPSAKFFSRNPSSFDRLIPWLKRELKVLCGNQRPLIHTLQSFIAKNMTQHDLHSQEFEALLRPHLHHFTAHFLHEFISFVKSPFNVKKYDWNALYACHIPPQEDSDSSISSASSGDVHSQLPNNNQETSRRSGNGNLGYWHCNTETDLTAMITAEDSKQPINKGDDLEDLSKIDVEKGRCRSDSLSPDTKAQPAELLSHPQKLQCTKENEGMGELHPIQTHGPKNTEASKNSTHLLASSDYNASSFNHRVDLETAGEQNSTKEAATKWQRPVSEERHTMASPGKTIIFKKSKSRGTECSLEITYSPLKGRHRGGSRARHPRERRHSANCPGARDKKCRRQQSKSRSRDGHLFYSSTLPLRSENMVTGEIKKSKSQDAHQFRKLGGKESDYLRNRLPSEPGWRYLYYRQDCERYRYEEPLCRKGEPTRVYSPKPRASSRARSYFPTENHIAISQETLTKDWHGRSERCRTARSSRGRFALVRHEKARWQKEAELTACGCWPWKGKGPICLE